MATAVDLRSPTGGTLADAHRAAANGDVYQALLAYVAGSVISISMDDGTQVDSRESIRETLRGLPWPLAEWIAFNSMIMAGASEEVDITFVCPRCSSKFYRDDDPVKIGDLPIKESDIPPTFDVILSSPVVFKDTRTDEALETVTSLAFRLPTIGDCIRCTARVGTQDDTRLQYAIWAEAITGTGNGPADQKWRGTWGAQVFERMAIADLRNVSQAFGAWGIDNTVEANCPQCGKRYKQEVPTGSFFASALKA
jgi:DNA-directed RNA polymerase subunit RPC12/RpoP